MSTKTLSLAQRMEAARKRELNARKKKEREAAIKTDPAYDANVALSRLFAKMSKPPSVYAHQETPFGESRRESSATFSLSSSKVKKLPVYKQLIALLASNCPRFSVQIEPVKSASPRQWRVVIEHPGLTRAQYFGDHSNFSVYEKALAEAIAESRAERLENLRRDRRYVAGFNKAIADWIPKVEPALINWYARTGKAETELTFADPWHIPYDAERLARLPAYKALEAAMAKLDKNLRVTAETRSAGMGNTDLVIKVSMTRFRRGV